MDDSRAPVSYPAGLGTGGMAAVCLVVLIAFGFRAAYFCSDGLWKNPMKHLPSEEVNLAQSLADGKGFVTPYRPVGQYVDQPSAKQMPGFPLLLAGVIKLCRLISTNDYWPYRIMFLLNAILGSVTIGILAVVAGRTSRSMFWCTALLGSVWPTLLFNSVMLWSTPVGLLGIAVALWYALDLSGEPLSTATSIIVGLMWGVFTLFAAVVAPVLGLALLARGYRRSYLRQSLISMVLAGATWLLVLAPWIIRNQLVFHRFIPLRNDFGMQLWLGNLPESDGSVTSSLQDQPLDRREDQTLISEIGEDKYQQIRSRDAVQIIRADPVTFWRKTLHRIQLYWFGDVTKRTVIFGVVVPNLSDVNVVKILANGFLLLCAVLGTFLWPEQPRKWVCWVSVMLIPVPFYFTLVYVNYRSYVDPFLCLLAGAFLARLIDRLPIWQENQFA